MGAPKCKKIRATKIPFPQKESIMRLWIYILVRKFCCQLVKYILSRNLPSWPVDKFCTVPQFLWYFNYSTSNHMIFSQAELCNTFIILLPSTFSLSRRTCPLVFSQYFCHSNHTTSFPAMQAKHQNYLFLQTQDYKTHHIAWRAPAKEFRAFQQSPS